MKRKVLSIFMALSIILSLSACGDKGSTDGTDIQNTPVLGDSENTDKADENTDVEEVSDTTDNEEVSNVGLESGLEFSDDLISYLREAYSEENFMVSPTSLKSALALATLGATDDTQAELVSASGHNSLEDYMNWANRVKGLTDKESKSYIETQTWMAELDESINLDELKTPMILANSIWYNTTNVMGSNATVKDEYKQAAAEKLGAEAFDMTSVEMQEAINNWVNGNTNGLIPEVLSDKVEDDTCLMLVNTLYLKAAWGEDMYDIGELDFNTISGDKVSKEFISGESHYLYYKDEVTELVVLPIGASGSLSAVVVLGDTTNLAEKIANASNVKVHVKMPKMDIESTFSTELIDFLKAKGVSKAFVPGEATFGDMVTDPTSVYIGGIIQKTKLGLDENGIEAAAATVINMVANSAIIEEEPPVEFTADKPFSLYVVGNISDSNASENNDIAGEVLFYASYVK